MLHQPNCFIYAAVRRSSVKPLVPYGYLQIDAHYIIRNKILSGIIDWCRLIRETFIDARQKVRLDCKKMTTYQPITAWQPVPLVNQVLGFFNVSASKLVEYITFLVDNIFITAGDHVFKQTSGHTNGYRLCPTLGKFIPFLYEYNYVKENLRTDHTSELKWRYTNHLLIINNPAFQNKVSNIYPPQLCLKKTKCPEMASFVSSMMKMDLLLVCMIREIILIST